MGTSDRESYLRDSWQAYPPIPQGTLSLKKFGQMSPQSCPQSLGLAGKVLAVDPTDSVLMLGAQGEVWKFQLSGDWPLAELGGGARDGRAILAAGDCLWFELGQMKREKGDNRAISGLAKKMVLLAPCLEERPGKPGYWALGEQWSQFLSQVREFFQNNGCKEVWTPSLVPCPGMEPTLDPFEVELILGQGVRKNFFLPTSPELHLKKLLSSGGGDLFEIKECFRNGEVSDHHQPEFWMLEWYRAYADLDAIVDDIQNLLEHLSKNQIFPEPTPKLRQLTMAELFERFVDFELRVDTDRRALLELCEKWQIPVCGDELWDDLFHLLFLSKIEPLLSEMGPVIVRDFPPSQAALARLTATGWADRFELYWQGFEIANAFHELNDPEEQLRRCFRDNREREDRGKQPLPMDTDFIQALKNGMPPSGGIALGLERLFMAGLGYNDIRELRPFTIEDSLYGLS